MSKKGQALEQRKIKVKEWFEANQRAYKMSSLEDLISKALSMPSNMVKESVEALANDGSITKERVGSSTYYWLFSATKANHNVITARETIAKVKSLRIHIDSAKETYAQALVGKEDTEERRQLMQELDDIQRQLQELEAEEAKYAENDPELVLNLEKNIDECITHVNRWTDNIYTLIGFYKKRGTDMSTDQFLKHFQLPAELEDLPPRVPKTQSTLRTFNGPIVRKRVD